MNNTIANHDETKLPKWAQKRLADLRRDIEHAQARLDTVEQMNAVMCDPRRDWFTIPGPQLSEERDHRILFVLGTNQATPVCDLGRGDLLFIGRAGQMDRES